MVHGWMPGAQRLSGVDSGGVPRGGAPRVIWGTTESDPRAIPALSAARHLVQRSRPSHLVWNPRDGEMVQLLPATAAVPERLVCPNQLDRGQDGRLCIVVEVVGFAALPFTDGPVRGLGAIVSWLDTLGIAHTWPGGCPLRCGQAPGQRTSEALWAGGGHFGLSQFPGSTTASPGAISPQLILEAPEQTRAALPPERERKRFPWPGYGALSPSRTHPGPTTWHDGEHDREVREVRGGNGVATTPAGV